MSTAMPASKASTWRLPRPDALLGTRYRVGSVLGFGGMGTVIEAMDLERSQRVAIKIMPPELHKSAALKARFLREAETVAKLRSPHVTQVYDVGVHIDGSPFLVMELLEGKDLEQLVREKGPLPVTAAVDYVLQACHAIAEAHGAGIIHRDLKPSNLFYCPQPDGDPLIKVLDFGISKLTEPGVEVDENSLTVTNTAMGSPRYASPEQLRDAKRVDLRTDIWSLGTVLHRLITGSYPFPAKTLAQQMVIMIHEPPTSIRAQTPEAPAALEAVVQRCLEWRPERRFRDIAALAIALAPMASPAARDLAHGIVESSAYGWPRLRTRLVDLFRPME